MLLQARLLPMLTGGGQLSVTAYVSGLISEGYIPQTSQRTIREARQLARMADAALARNPTLVLEILLRRLAGILWAEMAQDWNVCTAMELQGTSMMPVPTDLMNAFAVRAKHVPQPRAQSSSSSSASSRASGKRGKKARPKGSASASGSGSSGRRDDGDSRGRGSGAGKDESKT
jgi:hypothetical protein